MSIRMHILLMLLWEMFWLPFLMFSGYVVGALVVNHEAAIFVGIVVGFFWEPASDTSTSSKGCRFTVLTAGCRPQDEHAQFTGIIIVPIVGGQNARAGASLILATSLSVHDWLSIECARAEFTNSSICRLPNRARANWPLLT